jgi:hypothetical protein
MFIVAKSNYFGRQKVLTTVAREVFRIAVKNPPDDQSTLHVRLSEEMSQQCS